MDTPDLIALLTPRLARIEALVDRLIAGPERPVISTAEAMTMLGVKSPKTFLKLRNEWNIPQIFRGRYRRVDVVSAASRIATQRLNQHRRDAEAEVKAEARRLLSHPNPHDE